MRIISAFAALRIVIALLFIPTMALAAEAGESNETQIKPNIKNNLIIDNQVFGSDFEGFMIPSKTDEDIAREKILARYEAKRQATIYPKGKFTINASAYTAAADECGKSDGITASGLKVKVNETIACPPQYPFGTKMKIEGMGTYVCQDRGGAIKGNHIDIYVETKKEAFSFGRRNLLAEVIR